MTYTSLERRTLLPESAYPSRKIQAPIMSEEAFISNLEQLGFNGDQIDLIIGLRENGVEIELNTESINRILEVNRKLNSLYKTVDYINLCKKVPGISRDETLELAKSLRPDLRPHQIDLYISLRAADYPHEGAFEIAMKSYAYQVQRYEHIRHELPNAEPENALELAMMRGLSKDDMEAYIDMASQFSDIIHEEILEIISSETLKSYKEIRQEIPKATHKEALEIIQFLVSKEIEIGMRGTSPINSFIELCKNTNSTHKEILEVFQEVLMTYHQESMKHVSLHLQRLYAPYSEAFRSYEKIRKEIPKVTHKEALEIIQFFLSIDARLFSYSSISQYVKFHQYSTHKEILEKFQKVLNRSDDPLEVLRKYAEMHKEFPGATHDEIDKLIKVPYRGAFEALYEAAYYSASRIARAFENAIPPEALVSYCEGFQGGILSEAVLRKLQNYVEHKNAKNGLAQLAQKSLTDVLEDVTSAQKLAESAVKKLQNYVKHKDTNNGLAQLTQKSPKDFLEDLNFNQKLLGSSFFAITLVQQWPEFINLFDKVTEKSGVDFYNYLSKDSSISTLVDILNDNAIIIKGVAHTGFSVLAAISSYQLGSVSVPIAILANSCTYNLNNIGAFGNAPIIEAIISAAYTLPNVAIGVASGAIGMNGGIILVGVGFATALGYEALKETIPEVASAIYVSYVTSQSISGFMSGNYMIGALYLPGTINALDKMLGSFFYESSGSEVIVIPIDNITPVETVGAVLEEIS